MGLRLLEEPKTKLRLLEDKDIFDTLIDKTSPRPNDRRNFFFVKPGQEKEVIKRQWKSYFDNPEKWGIETIEDAVRKFDQQNPENKLKELKKRGIDIKQKLKDFKTSFMNFLDPTAEASDGEEQLAEKRLEGAEAFKQRLATSLPISKFLDFATKFVPVEFWNQAEQTARGYIGQGVKAAKSLPRIALGATQIPGLEDEQTLQEKDEMLRQGLQEVGEFTIRSIALPPDTLRSAVGASIDLIQKKPAGEIVEGILATTLSMEDSQTLVSRIPFQEAEQGDWFKLVPRATAEAFETLLVYRLTYGNAIDRIKKAYKSNKIYGVQQEMDKIATDAAKEIIKDPKKYKLEFPQHWTPEDKLGRVKAHLMNRMQSNPGVGDYLYSRQAAGPRLGRKLAEVKGQARLPFKVGDTAKFGKQEGKIIRIEGNKAILGVAGKEISAELANLEKAPPQPISKGKEGVVEGEVVKPSVSVGGEEAELQRPLAKSQVKAQIRRATGQYTPVEPTIKEPQALRRILEREEQVARVAGRISKKKTKEVLRLISKIKKLPIEGMGYEERAQIEQLKTQLKSTRTLQGLRELFAQVNELKEQGKAKFIQTKEAKDAQFELDKDLLVKTINAPPSKLRPKGLITEEPPRKEPIKTGFAITLRPMRIFDMADGGQDFEGPKTSFFILGLMILKSLRY